MFGKRPSPASPDLTAVPLVELVAECLDRGLAVVPAGMRDRQTDEVNRLQRELERLQTEAAGWVIAWNGASERWLNAELEIGRVTDAMASDAIAHFQRGEIR